MPIHATALITESSAIVLYLTDRFPAFERLDLVRWIAIPARAVL